MNLFLFVILIVLFLIICWAIRVRPFSMTIPIVAVWLLIWIIVFFSTDLSRLHILWIIPTAYIIIPRLYSYLTINIPVLGKIMLYPALILRYILWIGIDKRKRLSKIETDLHKIIEETLNKRK